MNARRHVKSLPSFVAALLCACGPAPESDQSRSAATPGREETRTIRNVEATGMAGAAIADRIDASLEANDQRLKDLEAGQND